MYVGFYFTPSILTLIPIQFPLFYLQNLYYYMRNSCNLIGLEQWYFSLIWSTYMWKLQPFAVVV